MDKDDESIKNILNEVMIAGGAAGCDTINITLPNDYIDINYGNISTSSTITLTGPSTYSSGGGTYTIGTLSSPSYTVIGSASDTITFDSSYQFNWGDAQEFVDSFPDWQRVQDMCKKYPGLEIALRNFRTVYTLVKDDYDNPKDKK